MAHGAEIPAVVRWFKGDFDSAAVLLDKAAGLYREISNQQCSAHFLENASAWAQCSGRVEDAAALLGSASALRLDTGIPTPSYEDFLFDDILTAVRDELGDRFTDAWDRGSERSMEEALDYVRQITSTSASEG